MFEEKPNVLALSDLAGAPVYDELPLHKQSTWVQSMQAAIQEQPLWQMLENEFFDPQIEARDPNYNPFINDAEALVGYEDYSHKFWGAGSREEVDLIKMRIDRSNERQQLASELGFFSLLATELANPVNLIPLPGLAAVRGVRAGLMAGAASVGAISAGEEALRMVYDPNATAEQAAMNVGMATVLGGVLGGGVGAWARMRGKADSADLLDELAIEYEAEFAPNRMANEAGLEIPRLGDQPQPYFETASGGEFVVRPTTEGASGIASALGIEKITARMTVWGQGHLTRIASVGDMVDKLLGDYGLMLNKNKLGMKTDPGVQLSAGWWRGMGTDAVRALEQIYTKYMAGGGEGGARFGDMSPTVTLGNLGVTNGKMNPQDFYREIFKAHKSDRLEHPDPFVMEGVQVVRKLFDTAFDEGIRSGLIRTKDGRLAANIRKVERLRSLREQVSKLDPNDDRDMLSFVFMSNYEAAISAELRATFLRNVDLGPQADVLVASMKKLDNLTGKDLQKRIDDLKGSAAAYRERMMNEQAVARDREILESLKAQEAARGLTEKQLAYYEYLSERLGKYDAEIAKGDPDIRDWMTVKQREYLDDMERWLAMKMDDGGEAPKDKYYLPRYWLADKVLEREDELRRILTQWFVDNPKEGTFSSPEAIAERVENAIDNIVGRARKEDLQLFDDGGIGATFQSKRDIDIPNELVIDFIETDVTKLMRAYSQRFGLMSEMTRAFGDTSGTMAIEDVVLQATREVKIPSLEEAVASVQEIEKLLIKARDKATGRIYDTSEKGVAARRRAGYVKAYGILTSMGTAVVSSLTEPARAIMVHGFARTLGASLEQMSNTAALKNMTAEMRTITGEGGDAVLNTGMTRFVNDGGPVGGAAGMFGKAGQKMTDYAYGPYFKMTLLTPWTDLMKNWNNVLGARFLYEDMMSVANNTADAKTIQRLASIGIDADDAAKLAAQPVELVDGKFNFDQWPDQRLARRFGAAVAGQTRRAIVTAGDADLPEIAKGFWGDRELPMITLPLQFMSWGFGAVNKIFLSTLQGRDKSRLAGAFALIGMGYMVEKLKQPDWAWEKMSTEERMVRAFDRSGLIGVFSDIPTMVETVTMGTVSARGIIGLEPYVRNPTYADSIGEFGGPALGKVADLVGVMLDQDADAKDVAGAVRRSIPLNNVLYWNGLLKDFEDWTFEEYEDDFYSAN